MAYNSTRSAIAVTYVGLAGIAMASMVVMEAAAAPGLSVSHPYAISLGLSASLGAEAGVINAVYYSTMQAMVPDNVLAAC